MLVKLFKLRQIFSLKNNLASLINLIMQSDFHYSHIKRKLVCSNSLFEVYFDHLELPTNSVDDYLIVKPKVAQGEKKIVGICVLPQVDSNFALMKGWRHQFKDIIWQAPAGFVDPGEDHASAALRELREETSLLCDPLNLVSLGYFIPDAGLIEGRVALYLAKDCKSISGEISQEIGMGKIHLFTASQLRELICNSHNMGGSTIITCMRSLDNLQLI